MHVHVEIGSNKNTTKLIEITTKDDKIAKISSEKEKK